MSRTTVDIALNNSEPHVVYSYGTSSSFLKAGGKVAYSITFLYARLGMYVLTYLRSSMESAIHLVH